VFASRHRGYWLELGIVTVLDGLVMVTVVLATRSPFAVLTVAATALAWKFKGLYDPRIGLSVLDDLPALVAGTIMGLVPAMIAAVGWTSVHAGTILLTGVGLAGGATAGRCLAYAEIRRQRAKGRITHRTLMIGAGVTALALIERIRAHPESGLNVVGMISDRPPRVPMPVPVLGMPRQLTEVVRHAHVSDVIVGYGGTPAADLIEVIRACDSVNVGIYVVPRLFELSTHTGDDHIWGLPLVRMRGPAHRRLTWRLKRAFDVVMASLALLVATPIFLCVALAVRWELGPGVFFRQLRVGAGGRTFTLLKFRSLAPVPPGDAAPWTVSHDGLGQVGRFIRRYSLDELPQLLNVLRGDMSLVGPRPERPEYVEQFSSELPWYRHRHRVPSGLTGLAAVNGLRGDTSIEDRARFDNWYIDNWSLWLDTKILVRTVWSVLAGTGA